MTRIDLSIFNNAAFICLFLSGIIVWLVGIYLINFPSKFPNMISGYKTPRSMKSQEAWDYAQIYGTKRIITGAQVTLVFSFVSLFFHFSEEVGTWIAITIVLISLITPLIITEKELKEKFG